MMNEYSYDDDREGKSFWMAVNKVKIGHIRDQ
jgi:hypothetical protein